MVYHNLKLKSTTLCRNLILCRGMSEGKFVISYMLQHAVNLKCTLNPLKDGAKNKLI